MFGTGTGKKQVHNNVRSRYEIKENENKRGDLRVGSPEPLSAGAVQPDEAPALAGNHLPTAAA